MRESVESLKMQFFFFFFFLSETGLPHFMTISTCIYFPENETASSFFMAGAFIYM